MLERHCWMLSQHHLNMHIQMEGKFTLWMCLCNQYNNFVLCMKHLFSVWTMDHVLFGVLLKFTRGVSMGILLVGL